MISAFGVEHGDGDISKALPGLGLAGGVKRLGQNVGQMSRQGATKMGGMAGKNINKPGMRTLGRGQIKAGQGLKKVSNFAMKRPGLVGGTAVGGAGAATFGAGAATNSAASQNKRMPQYR